MISGGSEWGHREGTRKAVTRNELKKVNDQPESRNFGLFYFNQLICY